MNAQTQKATQKPSKATRKASTSTVAPIPQAQPEKATTIDRSWLQEPFIPEVNSTETGACSHLFPSNSTLVWDDEMGYLSNPIPSITPEPGPSTPSTDEMVPCSMCGELLNKKKAFRIANSSGGQNYYCSNVNECNARATAAKGGKKPTVQQQAAQATAQAAATPKRSTGAKPVASTQSPSATGTTRSSKAGIFDSCPITPLGNKRHNSESVRTGVYNYFVANPGATILQAVEDGQALLPVVRDCVKKLFADGKISIQGWKMLELRTFNWVRDDQPVYVHEFIAQEQAKIVEGKTLPPIAA